LCAIAQGIRTRESATLKTFWLAAFQPCGERLEAILSDWPPVYEQERRLLNTALRQTLLARLT
jgi:hypothetical protein